MKKQSNLKISQIGKKLESYLEENDFQLYTMDIQLSKKYDIEYIGYVRHNRTKSLNALTGILTGLKSIFGGNLTFYNNLMSRTRDDTVMDVVGMSLERGANAIVGLRIDTSESQGLVDVFCYGTAVKITMIKQKKIIIKK